MRFLLKALRWLLGGVGILFGIAAIALTIFRWQADARETRIAAEAAPPSGRYVRAHDIDMFVQEEGPADAPAVVFIHGTGAWSETWRPTLKAVAKAGFRAIAVDLPPFGYSARPASQRYERPDQAQRIIGALDTLGLKQVILVGHSFGAGPTVEATLAAPGRIRALVLVDAALGLLDLQAAGAAPDSPGLVQHLLNMQPLRDSLVATFLTNPRFTKRLVQSFIANPALATDERTALYQQPLTVKGTTPAVGAWLPALLLPPSGARSYEIAAYQTLTMPVHIIWGALDTVTPLQQGEHIRTITPKATLAVMPDVGHIPQFEDAAQFNAVLLQFLTPLLTPPEPSTVAPSAPQ
jgi:pimeloyl-ACP methyl ester carboxylesterase